MECPQHKLRSDLPPMIERIRDLPIDARGYPVPYFVQWLKKEGKEIIPCPAGTGEPDFRVVDPNALQSCIKESKCWVCGKPMGVHRAYVVGPMCVINRTSAEPPSHVDCAMWSIQACPFLTRPNMVRREDEMTRENEKNIAGIMIKRNPGVIVLWIVRNFLKIWNDGSGKILFDLGNPETIKWFKEGRPATTDEAIDAINTGLQALLDLAESAEERNEILAKRDKLVHTLREAK